MSKPLLDRRWPWVAAALVVVLVFLSTFVRISFGPVVDARPEGTIEDIETLPERADLNVLFILIDTLRADRLGAYGYERETSPNLDRLAAHGIRFDRHLSQSSWTKASMASLWTATNPTRTGVTRYDDSIPEEAVTGAEVFAEAGFLTAGIYRNGWVAPTFRFDQGFEVYMKPASRRIPPAVKMKNPTLTDRGTDEDVVEAAVEFLRVHGHERWFLYMHMMDVHEYTYDESSALFGGTYSDVYDNAIHWTDSLIGILFEYLADMELDHRTVVVIGSDHGEAFRERDLEGHARFLYRETTEVPLILSLPFRLDEGVVVESRSRNVDIMPTLFDLTGVAPPEGIDGRSLLPDILASARGEPPPDPAGVAVAHLDQTWGQRDRPVLDTVAVTEGPLRYVRLSARDGGLEQLFDASVDPKELVEVTEQQPESLERLRARADAFLAEPPRWGDAPEKELDELELNQLRALGYAIP